MIQSYRKKNTAEENYDSIVIGSGIGGLSTAAILSKEGQKVLVLERHYTAGGFTHIFKRKGFEWDVGIHYIGEVQKPNSGIRKLFDYITDGELKWADMGEVYDRIIIGDKHYDLVKGVENFRQQMHEYFSLEKAATDEYISMVFAATKSMQKYFMDKALPPLVSKVVGSFLRKPFHKYSDQTTYEVLSGLTKNEELIKVLSAQYGDYGLPPKKSSFAMHATVVRHYFSGGSFPIGGSSQVVENIDPIIEASGGTILISAEVKEIIVESNKAVGVRMKDDKVFYAKNIISGAGIITTYQKLLPEAMQNKYKVEQILQKVKPSISHACLYVGLDGSPDDLKLPKTNYWIYPEDLDHDASIDRYLQDVNAEFPVVYISFPSAKDPDWSNRYPGKSTIDIITLVPWDTFAKWEGSRWMKRGEDYDALKEKIAQRLLEALYKQIPQAKGKIEHYELSTPLTTQHFVNYSKGEIYGLDHSPDRFRQKFLQPRTPIKNLYLTGQDIVTCGVGAALYAGLLTGVAVTGKNLLKKVMA